MLPGSSPNASIDSEEVEIDLLCTASAARYGYDFAHYSRASLKRRLARALAQTGLTHFSGTAGSLFHDERSFDEFLKIMSITVTEMFRDPDFYQAVRAQVVPALKTYPFIQDLAPGLRYR